MIMIPNGIFGFNVILEVLFAIITFFVANRGFKIFKITSQKQIFYLSWAFLLISISNILQSILNVLIITKFNENICTLIKIQSVMMFNNIGIYTNIFFMIIGLSLLTFMTFKYEKIKGFLLIAGLTLIGIFSSLNIMRTFFIISAFLLIIISLFFLENYLKYKNNKTLIILIAFILLLISNILFLFAIINVWHYIMGLIIELFAYILVLVNFIMVLKK